MKLSSSSRSPRRPSRAARRKRLCELDIMLHIFSIHSHKCAVHEYPVDIDGWPFETKSLHPKLKAKWKNADALNTTPRRYICTTCSEGVHPIPGGLKRHFYYQECTTLNRFRSDIVIKLVLTCSKPASKAKAKHEALLGEAN